MTNSFFWTYGSTIPTLNTLIIINKIGVIKTIENSFHRALGFTASLAVTFFIIDIIMIG